MSISNLYRTIFFITLTFTFCETMAQDKNELSIQLGPSYPFEAGDFVFRDRYTVSSAFTIDYLMDFEDIDLSFRFSGFIANHRDIDVMKYDEGSRGLSLFLPVHLNFYESNKTKMSFFAGLGGIFIQKSGHNRTYQTGRDSYFSGENYRMIAANVGMSVKHPITENIDFAYSIDLVHGVAILKDTLTLPKLLVGLSYKI